MFVKLVHFQISAFSVITRITLLLFVTGQKWSQSMEGGSHIIDLPNPLVRNLGTGVNKHIRLKKFLGILVSDVTRKFCTLGYCCRGIICSLNVPLELRMKKAQRQIFAKKIRKKFRENVIFQMN